MDVNRTSVFNRYIDSLKQKFDSKGQKVPILIAGLVESGATREGSKIVLRNGSNVILRRYSDSDGKVSSHISAEWIGKKITLAVFSSGFEIDDVDVEIDKLGLFHAVRMRKDMIQHGIDELEKSDVRIRKWNSAERHRAAQELVQKAVRKRRIRNYGALSLEYGGTAIVTVGTAFVAPYIAIPAGAIWYIVAHKWIAPKAAGM